VHSALAEDYYRNASLRDKTVDQKLDILKGLLEKTSSRSDNLGTFFSNLVANYILASGEADEGLCAGLGK
jgi:hypothetical protein